MRQIGDKMNKKSLLSLILTCTMLAGTLISCNSGENLPDDTQAKVSESVTESATEKENKTVNEQHTANQ